MRCSGGGRGGVRCEVSSTAAAAAVAAALLFPPSLCGKICSLKAKSEKAASAAAAATRNPDLRRYYIDQILQSDPRP